eukprot:scaffold2021_cov176-Amphora_coffeaeformis.AAC.17
MQQRLLRSKTAWLHGEVSATTIISSLSHFGTGTYFAVVKSVWAQQKSVFDARTCRWHPTDTDGFPLGAHVLFRDGGCHMKSFTRMEEENPCQKHRTVNNEWCNVHVRVAILFLSENVRYWYHTHHHCRTALFKDFVREWQHSLTTMHP